MGKRQGKRAYLGRQLRAMFNGREMAIAPFALDELLADGNFLTDAAEAVLAAESSPSSAMPWDEMPPPEKRFAVDGGVAVAHVGGLITHGLSNFERWWIGAVEVEEVADMVEAAANDERVRAIVLSIDSPGGMVTGTPEAAARIAAVAERVPIVAHTSNLLCSAAYWLASPSAAIYSTGSATVGSVGCYCVHFDLSRAYENAGVGLRVFRSGKQKAAGVEGAALSEEQAQVIADRISAIGAEFRAFVARGRGELPGEAVDGRAVSGEEGRALGLVDSLGTLADAVADARILADLRREEVVE